MREESPVPEALIGEMIACEDKFDFERQLKETSGTVPVERPEAIINVDVPVLLPQQRELPPRVRVEGDPCTQFIVETPSASKDMEIAFLNVLNEHPTSSASLCHFEVHWDVPGARGNYPKSYTTIWKGD